MIFTSCVIRRQWLKRAMLMLFGVMVAQATFAGKTKKVSFGKVRTIYHTSTRCQTVEECMDEEEDIKSAEDSIKRKRFLKLDLAGKMANSGFGKEDKKRIKKQISECEKDISQLISDFKKLSTQTGKLYEQRAVERLSIPLKRGGMVQHRGELYEMGMYQKMREGSQRNEISNVKGHSRESLAGISRLGPVLVDISIPEITDNDIRMKRGAKYLSYNSCPIGVFGDHLAECERVILADSQLPIIPVRYKTSASSKAKAMKQVQEYFAGDNTIRVIRGDGSEKTLVRDDVGLILIWPLERHGRHGKEIPYVAEMVSFENTKTVTGSGIEEMISYKVTMTTRRFGFMSKKLVDDESPRVKIYGYDVPANLYLQPGHFYSHENRRQEAGLILSTEVNMKAALKHGFITILPPGSDDLRRDILITQQNLPREVMQDYVLSARVKAGGVNVAGSLEEEAYPQTDDIDECGDHFENALDDPQQVRALMEFSKRTDPLPPVPPVPPPVTPVPVPVAGPVAPREPLLVSSPLIPPPLPPGSDEGVSDEEDAGYDDILDEDFADTLEEHRTKYNAERHLFLYTEAEMLEYVKSEFLPHEYLYEELLAYAKTKRRESGEGDEDDSSYTLSERDQPVIALDLTKHNLLKKIWDDFTTACTAGDVLDRKAFLATADALLVESCLKFYFVKYIRNSENRGYLDDLLLGTDLDGDFSDPAVVKKHLDDLWQVWWTFNSQPLRCIEQLVLLLNATDTLDEYKGAN